MSTAVQVAVAAALAAGRIQKERIDRIGEIRYKGEIDLVTEVDLLCEQEILGRIRKQFPSHALLAEESGTSQGDADHQWIVDPLDGTVNYPATLSFLMPAQIDSFIRMEETAQFGGFIQYDAIGNLLSLGVRESGADTRMVDLTRIVTAGLEGNLREVRPATTNLFRLGSDAFRWRQVWSAKGIFTGLDESPDDQDDVVSRNAKNAVVARGRFNTAGVTGRCKPSNV